MLGRGVMRLLCSVRRAAARAIKASGLYTLLKLRAPSGRALLLVASASGEAAACGCTTEDQTSRACTTCKKRRHILLAAHQSGYGRPASGSMSGDIAGISSGGMHQRGGGRARSGIALHLTAAGLKQAVTLAGRNRALAARRWRRQHRRAIK